jgi:mono/diheme cytochrome c family protein
MGLSLRGAIVAGAAAAWLALPGMAAAQDAALITLGKQVWLTQVNCKECHGTMANGVPDFPLAPTGADLRSTFLTPEQMTEVVRCGKPASEMPYFSSRSWTGATQCFGMTAAQVGAGKPPQAGTQLADRQIAAVVAMVFAEFVGKGPVTQEKCVAFMGAESAKCREYPR